MAGGSRSSNRSRTIAANSFWSSLDGAVTIVAGLVSSIAVARLLGPLKLGYYGYIMWISAATSQLAGTGVPLATRKYLAEYIGRRDYSQCRRIIRSSYRYQGAIALCVLAGGLLFARYGVSEEHRLFATIAIVSLLPSLLLGVTSSINVAFEDFRSNVLSSIVATLVNFCGIVLSLVFRWDLVGLASSLLVSRAADLSIRYLASRRQVSRVLAAAGGEGEPDQLLQGRILRFCLQAAALQVLNLVVWDRSEMLFLERFSDIRQVAFYSISFGITQHLLTAPRAFGYAASTNLMVRVGEDESAARGMTATIVRFTSLIALPLAFGMAALSGPVVRLLYGAQYLPAIPVLAILAMFNSARALVMPGQQLLTALDKQSVVLKRLAIAAAVNIGLDLALIPRFGAVGGAVANGCAQTFCLILIWRGAIRHAGAVFPTGKLLRIGAAAILMTLGVAGLVWILPSLAAALLGVPLGALAFVIGLRLLKALEPQDVERLASIQDRLPAAVRAVYGVVLGFLRRAGKVEAEAERPPVA